MNYDECVAWMGRYCAAKHAALKRVFVEIATFSNDFSAQIVTSSRDFCKFRIFPVTTSQTA